MRNSYLHSVESNRVTDFMMLDEDNQLFLLTLSKEISKHLKSDIKDLCFITEEDESYKTLQELFDSPDSFTLHDLSLEECDNLGCSSISVKFHKDLGDFVETVCEDFKSIWFLMPSHKEESGALP